MTSMPYRDGCPKCDAVRSYWQSVNDSVQNYAGTISGSAVVGVTINAEDVPHCQEHLGDV